MVHFIFRPFFLIYKNTFIYSFVSFKNTILSVSEALKNLKMFKQQKQPFK